MASLADIRARLKAQEDNKNRNSGPREPSAVYPHWNINEGDTAIIRFLEDADPENPYFWQERLMFRLPFNGMVNVPNVSAQDASRQIIVQVPCMEMYGKQDAVLNEVRQWFKDDSLEEMGRKYWKKRSYIFQGFVRSNPMTDDETPENPIRRFMISPQIFTLIKNSLMDPEIEELPTHAERGLDFRILKSSKGGYADYSNSSWARKESELTEEELKAVDEHGLFNLADFLPEEPTEELQKVIFEMFEASVEGEPYDFDRWGQFYTPPGVSRAGNDSNASTSAPAQSGGEKSDVAETKSKSAKPKPAAEPVAEEAPAAAADDSDDEDEDAAKNDKAADILKMIRSRQQ